MFVSQIKTPVSGIRVKINLRVFSFSSCHTQSGVISLKLLILNLYSSISFLFHVHIASVFTPGSCPVLPRPSVDGHWELNWSSLGAFKHLPKGLQSIDIIDMDKILSQNKNMQACKDRQQHLLTACNQIVQLNTKLQALNDMVDTYYN